MREETYLRIELLLTKHYSPAPGPLEDGFKLPRLQKPELRALMRNLTKYRNEVGIAYYNLDISDGRALGQFLGNFALVIPAEALGYIRYALKEDQPRYRDMVDKSVRNEELSEDQLFWASHMIQDRAFHISEKNGAHYISFLPTGKTILDAGLRVAYQWLFLISSGPVQAARCDLPGCVRIFVQRSAGHVRRYCSEACKLKAYRMRVKSARKRGGRRDG